MLWVWYGMVWYGLHLHLSLTYLTEIDPSINQIKEIEPSLFLHSRTVSYLLAIGPLQLDVGGFLAYYFSWGLCITYIYYSDSCSIFSLGKVGTLLLV